MPRALVPLAPGFEELEAVAVIDLLRRAGVEVVTASLDPEPVRGSRDTVIVADTTLDRVQDASFDVIVVPGGAGGVDRLVAEPRLRAMLQSAAREGRYVAAICAGPRVLGEAGLLDGRRATSFPGALAPLKRPIRIEDAPVVVDGKIITSQGPGTAIDFALTLVEILCGAAKRNEVESRLQRPRHHLTPA